MSQILRFQVQMTCTSRTASGHIEFTLKCEDCDTLRLKYGIFTFSFLAPFTDSQSTECPQTIVHPFIHYVVCLPIGPWLFQRVRSSASSFSLQYLLFSLRPSSSSLHPLPRLSIPLNFSVNNAFYKAVPTQDVADPVRLTSLYFM
jgi:hypothetical protein